MVGPRRVPAADRHACLGETGVELEHVVKLGLRGDPETDEQRLGACTGSGEVAEVDGGCAEAELAPGEPVEPEVNAFDERVLGEDKPGLELRRVIFDSLNESATFQLGEQAELPELR